MAAADVDGQPRWNAARDALLAAQAKLAAPDTLRLFTFGDALREVDPPTLRTLAPDAEHTDVHGAGQALLNRFAAQESRLSGILLLSDGRQTVPPARNDLAARARAAGIPISAIPLGGPVPRRDLALALRAAEHHGLSEGVCNHFSVELGDGSDRFLINPRGLHWSEIGGDDIVLKRSSLEEMWKPQLPVEVDANGNRGFTTDIGLIYFLDTTLGKRHFGHGGDQNGFISYIDVDPDKALATIIVFNTDIYNAGNAPPETNVTASLRRAVRAFFK